MSESGLLNRQSPSLSDKFFIAITDHTLSLGEMLPGRLCCVVRSPAVSFHSRLAGGSVFVTIECHGDKLAKAMCW